MPADAALYARMRRWTEDVYHLLQEISQMIKQKHNKIFKNAPT